MTTKEIQSGVLNLGNYYEELVPAYFALNLLKDQDVKDFTLTLNPSSFGKFDDLIVEIDHKDGPEYFAIQLKHREVQKEKLDVQEFCRKGKSFEIEQYKHAYHKLNSRIKENYKVILFTNAKFANTSKSKIYDIKRRKGVFTTSLFNQDGILHFQEKQYKKRYLFYDNFFLFSEQKNCTDLRKYITKTFCEDFQCDKSFATFYILFFEDLRKAFYDDTKINKKALLRKIIDLLLSTYIVHFPLQNQSNNKLMKLVKEALKKFDITVFYHKPKTNFNLEDKYDHTNLDEIMELSKKSKIIRKNSTPEENDLHKLSSYFIEELLFVKVNHKSVQTIISLINITENIKSFGLKFVLIDKKNILEKSEINSKNIFRNLAELKNVDKELYKEITDTFKISLQGRTNTSITIFETIYHLSLDQFITPNLLFECLDSGLVIGTRVEPLPEHYLERSLIRSTVLYLEKLCIKNQTLTVHCGDQLEDFKSFLKQSNFPLKIEDVEENVKHLLKTPILYLSPQEKCSNCSTHLRLAKNNGLYWNMFAISLNNPEIFDNNLNVIYGNPGSGKTTIMKYLANNCPLHYWVIYISLKEYGLGFAKEKNKFHIDDFLNSKDIISRQVLQFMKENGKLMFFFDDLGKQLINTNKHVIRVINEIKQLLKNGHVCWISCPERLQNLMQKQITPDNVFFIKELKPKEIELFVTNIVTNKNISKPNLKFICETILNSSEFKAYILKTPAFLKILSSMINKTDNFKSFVNSLNIAEIYTCFTEEQFNQKLSDNKDYLDEMYINLYHEECQIRALEIYLEPDDFAILNTKSRKMFIDQIKNYGDISELILNINPDDSIVFIYKSLTEYFAALWLKDNFRTIPRENRKFILKPQYKKIQHFLNLLLAQNCPLHLAICNRNFERVVEIAENHLNDLDDAERNPLHIASSLEIKHSLSTSSTNTYRKKLEDGYEQEAQIFEYIFSKTKNDFILEKDNFFEMNCFQFADGSLSLPFLEELSKKQELLPDYLDNFKNLSTLSEDCVRYGCITILKKVLEWKKLEDLESKNKPFIHLALECGQEEVALFLFEKESDFSKINSLKQTLLHVAAYYNCKKIVKKLLDLEVDTEATDLNKKTPLDLAVEKNHKEVVECLRNHVKINANNKNNSTILYKAPIATPIVKKNYYNDIVEATEDNRTRKESQNLVNFGEDVRRANTANETLLHTAAQEGDEKMVNLLIVRNKSIRIVKNWEGRIPLHLAAKHGHLKIVQLLINKEDINTPDKWGLTPLHLAAEMGHKKIVELLTEKGAQLLPSKSENKTPLHCAIRRGHTDIIEYFVSRNIDIRTKNETYLHFAARDAKSGVVIFLLTKWKKFVNEIDGIGRTPLHWAVEQKRVDVIRFLIQSGADVLIKDFTGNTPLDIATKTRQNDIINIISQIKVL